MTIIQRFEAMLSAGQSARLIKLDTPMRIQEFLDQTPYSPEPVYRCPLSVLRDNLAHCFDGAVFAALALARLGYQPLIIDLLPENDDDHVLTLFKQDTCYGAVAKSNFTGLRYREPVFRNLRELVMSYFDAFYNIARQRTLRGYTLPLNLHRYDRQGWPWEDSVMDAIDEGLGSVRKVPLLSPQQIAHLTPVDEQTYRAGLMVANPDGLYNPEDAKHHAKPQT